MTAQTAAQRKAAQRARDTQKIDFFNQNRDLFISLLNREYLRHLDIMEGCIKIESDKGCDMQRMIDSSSFSASKYKNLMDEISSIS